MVAGFVLGNGWGERISGIDVIQGQAVPVGDTGLSLRLDAVESVAGPGGHAWDTTSRIALLRGTEQVAADEVRINHPLIWGSIVVYPMGSQTGVFGADLITSEGAVQLEPGRDVTLTGGRSLTVRGVLDPGQRGGPYFGPGMLVALLDAERRVLGSAFLSPARREAIDLGGRTVSLAQLKMAPNGRFNVHDDPGLWLVLIGAVILALGTLWALAGYLGIRRLGAPT